MGWFSRRKRHKEKQAIKKTPAFERGAAIFRLHYPNYEYGVGSYGLPEVRDWGEGSTLRIGSYCSIADKVEILLGGHHRADWITTFPFPALIPEAQHIEGYNGTHGDVVVGSDVWLCSGCKILSGVTIGHGAVVAANSVVSKDVAPYSIVAGNPAKFVRWRFADEKREFLLQVRWWEWPVEEVRSIATLLCTDDMSAFIEYATSRPLRQKDR